MVLNDIIDQVSERPMSKATHLSSAFQVLIILTIIMAKVTFICDVCADIFIYADDGDYDIGHNVGIMVNTIMRW